MENEMTRIANDLEEKLRKTTTERNVFKAKYRSLITLMERMRSELRQITDHIEDEGDRVYFGSTNHADNLKHLANYAEMWVFDYELPPGDINKMEKDPYAEIRRLREENDDLKATIDKNRRVLDDPCIQKLRDGEPFFVLLGRDADAIEALGLWIRLRSESEGNSEKVAAAKQTLVDFVRFDVEDQDKTDG